ncbi:MAG: hypothetical protein MR294_00240 [Bacteroidales bacterium]|nr:hypothetical protein [Bacteroidales bacterium]
MKHLFTISLFCGLSLFALSCGKYEKTDDFVNLEESMSVSQTIKVNVQTRSGEVEPVEFIFSAVYDVDSDEFIDIHLSTNNPSIDNAEIERMFLEFISQEMTSDDSVLSQAESESFHQCIESCKDKYEKGQGRGRCKTTCYVDVAIRFIEALGGIFDIF